MKTFPKTPWLEKGYELFAIHGPHSIKIQQLAKAVAINKSSFYHLFGDYEVFEEELLQLHVDRTTALRKRLVGCEAVDPGQILLLIECKVDVLFQRQLRMHTNIDLYNRCYLKTWSIMTPICQKIWSKLMGVRSGKPVTPATVNILTDIFFQKITPENLTYEFIIQIVKEVEMGMKDLINSHNEKARI